MPDFKGAYEGTTGLRDEFTGKIVSAIFTYDSEYNNGNTLIARVEIVDEDGEEEVLKLSTGSGWEDADKGKTAKREDGNDPKGFNRSCNYQRFVGAAAQTEYADVMFSKAPPWDMSVWEDEPWFRFERREFPAFEKGAEPKHVIVPAEYLADKAEAPKKGAAKKAPAAKAESGETPAQKAKRLAAEKKAAAEAEASGGDDEESADLVLLKSIAKEESSHEAFMERAYGELEDADALEEFIVDEDWFSANG